MLCFCHCDVGASSRSSSSSNSSSSGHVPVDGTHGREWAQVLLQLHHSEVDLGYARRVQRQGWPSSSQVLSWVTTDTAYFFLSRSISVAAMKDAMEAQNKEQKYTIRSSSVMHEDDETYRGACPFDQSEKYWRSAKQHCCSCEDGYCSGRNSCIKACYHFHIYIVFLS